jgi:hypothetical protein
MGYGTGPANRPLSDLTHGELIERVKELAATQPRPTWDLVNELAMRLAGACLLIQHVAERPLTINADRVPTDSSLATFIAGQDSSEHTG